MISEERKGRQRRKYDKDNWYNVEVKPEGRRGETWKGLERRNKLW